MSRHPLAPEPIVFSAADLHAAAVGTECTDDGSGSCPVCGVALVECETCHSIGYHSSKCPELHA